jgi:hypothetical protein
MNAKAILLGAVMLGGIGGYGWSAMQPPSAGPVPAKAHSDASATHSIPRGLRIVLGDVQAPAASDRAWAARADDGGGQPARPARSVRAVEQSTYYSGCNEVRAAGKAPLYAGQPGYRPEMDGDGDGVACEPYRG